MPENDIDQDADSPLSPLPHNIATRVKARQATLTLLTGERKSTQAPNDRVKRQLRRQEESEIHPNVTPYNLSSNDDSLLNESDSAST